jgi:peptidoglycan/LPS O-acetylase OafA/YrhL
VLAYHSWLYSSPDRTRITRWPIGVVAPDLAFGVILFFTLSGFLLYRPYAAAVLRRETMPSPKRYLRNRALRIVPAYVVILLLVALVLRAAFVPADGGRASGAMTAPGLLVRNLLLVQGYDPHTLLTGIGPAWSLAVEAVFYLALPGLALLGWALARRATTRSLRRLAVLTPAMLMLALGATGKIAAAHALQPGAFHGWQPDWQSVLERSFWCQADLFAFGMALTVLRVDAEDGIATAARWARVAAVPLCLAAFAVGAAVTGLSDELGFSFYNTLIALAFACLLALVVLPTRGGRPSLLLRVLETRPFVSLGLISYSIFLWHEPLVRWLQQHGLTLGGAIGLVGNTLLLFAAAVVLSTLTYRFVELPALRRKLGGHVAAPTPAMPPEQVEAAP